MKPTILTCTLMGAVMALAACTSTNTIDGHQVRGTAAPETPVQQAAREFDEHWGKIVADAYGDDPQVQEAAREFRATENPGDLHARAPQWFKDGWDRYLEDADGRYAVLAVDKSARGWGYVYCNAADCWALEGTGQQSHKDLRYKHAALDLCRGNVREYQPDHRPDCAIYAIKDQIVWKGPMPWE